jgi:predicted permease
VSKESVAKILIYFMTPITVFWGVVKAPKGDGLWVIPLTYFVSCSLIALFVLGVLGKLFFRKQRNESHLLSFGAGNANSGYFAIPVGTAIFGEQAFPLIILTSMGFILYENTVGFFIAARGSFSVARSLQRVLKLPAVYSFILGIIAANTLEPASLEKHSDFIFSIRQTYSVLGMMLIGMGLGSAKFTLTDSLKYTTWAQFSKFCIWPALAAILYKWNVYETLGFSGNFSKLPLFTAFLPMAANTVAVAAEVGASAEKAALAVLLSTLLCWILLPWVMSF